MGVREVAFVRATPALCPSAADPCGDPSPFATVPGVRVPSVPKALGEALPDVVTGPDFWIASDGSHALTWSALQWSLWLPGGATATRAGAASNLLEAVIGVRFHQDVTPLLLGT